MKNVTAWRPTKFVPTTTGWRASRNPDDVFVGSRLITDILAVEYAQSIEEHCRGAVLDHGCGRAPLYGMYAPRASEIVCIDWPSSVHSSDHVDLQCDLNTAIPLPRESFDTIISSDVLEHLHAPALVFSEFARLLRPGGKLILGTPFIYWVHEAPHDYFRWTEYALRHYALAAGLSPLQIRAYGGSREVLADIVLKLVSGKSLRLASALHRVLDATGLINRQGKPARGPFALGHIAVLQRAA